MSLLRTIGLALACALSLSLAACSSEKESAAPEKTAAARITAPSAPRAQPALATTPQAVMICVDRALAAAPFTGSRRARLHQARHLQIGTTILINGAQTALKKGDTVWGLCQGPDPRLEVLLLAGENARLRSLAYYQTADANNRLTTHTYRDLAAQRKTDLDAVTRERDEAHGDLRRAGRWDWAQNIGLFILFAAAFLFAVPWYFRNSRIEALEKENERLKYDNGNLSREVDRLKKAHPDDT